MKNMFLSRKEKKKEEAAPQGGGISRALGKVSFEGFDWWLFTLMLIILAIGLIMVLSASGIVAEQVNGDKYYFFKRQLIFACGGGLVLWGAALMPRSWLYKLQYPAIFLSLFLLLLTLSPLTPSINGAKRWIPLGPVNLQPMEFVKISLALYLAYFMSSKQALVKTFSRGVIPPFAVTGLFCGLLLLQPDFGSAVVVASILFFMCLAGGTRFIYLFSPIPPTRAITWCSPCWPSARAAFSAWAWVPADRRCSICPKPTTTSSWPCWPRSWALWASPWSCCCSACCSGAVTASSCARPNCATG